MRITSKGQVTIPQDIREAAGMLPGTEVEFFVDGDAVRVIKAVDARRATRGQRAVDTLRSSRADFGGMSTDALIALLRGEP